MVHYPLYVYNTKTVQFKKSRQIFSPRDNSTTLPGQHAWFHKRIMIKLRDTLSVTVLALLRADWLIAYLYP